MTPPPPPPFCPPHQVSLLRKLVPNDAEYRKFLGAVVVIAANSGGAWSPIGDVTTTMLWINGNISTVSTMRYVSRLPLWQNLTCLSLFQSLRSPPSPPRRDR